MRYVSTQDDEAGDADAVLSFFLLAEPLFHRENLVIQDKSNDFDTTEQIHQPKRVLVMQDYALSPLVRFSNVSSDGEHSHRLATVYEAMATPFNCQSVGFEPAIWYRYRAKTKKKY